MTQIDFVTCQIDRLVREKWNSIFGHFHFLAQIIEWKILDLFLFCF